MLSVISHISHTSEICSRRSPFSLSLKVKWCVRGDKLRIVFKMEFEMF